MSVYLTLLKPGDTMLGMNLAHGGHLTHGHPLNFSGKLYTIVPYGVRKDDERIDYDEFERLADEHKPKMIIVGASAYPRVIDFARMARGRHARRRAADGGHGAHRRARRRRRAPEPRAARRLRHHHHAQDAARPARRHGAVPRAVRQGSRSHGVPRRAGRAADAHHRGQGGVLQGSGRRRRLPSISGRWSPTRSGSPPASPPTASASSAAAPTTTSCSSTCSRRASPARSPRHALGQAGITVNKNAIPFDQNPPMVASGIRLGTPAVTTRGMGEAEMDQIAGFIARVAGRARRRRAHSPW